MTSLDALRVEVSDDASQASLLPIGDATPGTLKPRQLVELLESHGVHHGVKTEALERFLERWKEGRVRDAFVVARGTPPKDPVPARLSRIAPPPRHGDDPVALLPLYVSEGEAVIAVEPAREGRPGLNVLGQLCPPPRLDETGLAEPGPGLEAGPGGVWYARRNGFLRESEGQIEVTRTLLHHHDLPAGVYRWTGDVEIEGSLPSGCELHAGGSVRIVGSVGERVSVVADGSVTVEGEIHGGMTTRVESGGVLKVGLVHRAILVADGDLEVGVGCLECECRTRRVFRAVAARLSGGRVEAVGGAMLASVGGEATSRTLVSVGLSDWVDEELHAHERQIRRWSAYYARLYEDFRSRYAPLLEDRSRIYKLSSRERRVYEEAHREVLAEQKRIDAKVSEIRSQQSRLHRRRARDDEAVIRLEGAARPGVSFMIRGKTRRVGEEGLSRTLLTLSSASGRILAVPLSLVDSSEMVGCGATSG